MSRFSTTSRNTGTRRPRAFHCVSLRPRRLGSCNRVIWWLWRLLAQGLPGQVPSFGGSQRIVLSYWKTLGRFVGPQKLLKLIRFYPPYLGARVSVTHVSEDVRTIEVQMPLSPLNRNYVGTQFGGS